MKRLQADRGIVLIEWTIISVLIIAAIVCYANFIHVQTVGAVRSSVRAKAVQQTDSGMNHARNYLRTPQGLLQLPIASSTTLTSATVAEGRYEVSLYRTFADINLVDGYATGYYYLPGGADVDPVTGQQAISAAANFRLRITNVSDFLLAVPGPLTVKYGSDLSSGRLYARELTLETGVTLPHTRLFKAYYFASVAPSASPVNVDFMTLPAYAQQLPVAPNFPVLDANWRGQYEALADPGPFPSFSGSVGIAAPYHVYYFPGAVLQVGVPSQPLQVTGTYVVYSTGDIYIGDSVTVVPGECVAFLAEGSIHIRESAPDNLVLEGNYMANNDIVADGPQRPITSSLTIQGGLFAGKNIVLAPVYRGTRQYTYQPCGNPDLMLPTQADLSDYRVTKGSKS